MKVAGRERCHEEATRTAPGPAEPHGPRRCGGPEHSVGLFKSGMRAIWLRARRRLLTSSRRSSHVSSKLLEPRAESNASDPHER